MPELAHYLNDPEFKAAFLANERLERINTGKVAALLVCVLMPVGIALDYFVYPHKQLPFAIVRLASAALSGLIWYLYNTELGCRLYKLLGMLVALLPALFMTWMIYETEGPASPYYAGLNLVLLGVSVVLRWSMVESLIAVGSVLAMYFAACVLRGTEGLMPVIFNNFYFLVLTGVIVVTGNYIFNQLRHREFILRYELEKNKRMLEASNQKLRELDQIKSRFFANISHELRTPLTLLMAPLETLLHRYSKSFDTHVCELLVTMHSNGLRLLKLINDLLDLVHLDSGRIKINTVPVPIREFVSGLASAVRQVADGKQIKLSVEVAPQLGTVLADKDKLEKILLNLIFNALKFTPPGGHVEISARKEGNALLLSVKDTGIGISEKHLPFIFNRFWQADDSAQRKYPGTGIGLALVKELTELLGGKVEVQSQEGKGTTFTVHLPYKEAEPATQMRGAEPTEAAGQTETTVLGPEEWLSDLYRRAELFPAVAPLRGAIRPVEPLTDGASRPTVLIADDEPDMLRFLKSELSPIYRVLEAADGQQAVEKAAQFLPDIILLDMMMPEKDGLQACREIRQNVQTQPIPVIMLTAKADEQTKLAALSAGASDFLTKPFSTTELHVRLKNLLDAYTFQRELARQNKVLQDTIQQLKETELQLVQTEKLASLGRMSAGIIHEINNPLNFAITGLYTLRNKTHLLKPDQQHEYLEILQDIEDGLDRVKKIVSDLRMFTHPESGPTEQVELAEVVEVALRLLSNELRGKVKLEQHVPRGHTVWANKNKLIHVCVNLLQNSLDALKRKQFDGDTPCITIRAWSESGRALLSVRDNGPGIKPEHMDKIFDPFFTTKDVGEGMGLGLSICYRIMREFNGAIHVKSEPGNFCEFTLEFPLKS
ncbi:MAG: ATP-binding protein [Verrucomicrobiae bacterium]|nr:ATP-binding protein [Verrucomicrobiae bacterium]MCX7722173.1 ATP-binding protein [Verrucomicrobiae bacterium]MDW7980787.1 ATP-binding protein [Verrucomicrobiales bacterium]